MINPSSKVSTSNAKVLNKPPRIKRDERKIVAKQSKAKEIQKSADYYAR